MGACQDERNRLTWMGLAGESTRGGTAIVPGTLTSAQYTQPYTYDTLDRLTSGPLGTYTYGDAAHLHAATAIGSAYTASYDAAGDMTCRAPNAFQTCAGSTPTGAPLTFDNEGRLASWTSTAQSCLSSHNPMTTETFAYDGEGRRVAESGVVRQCPYATQVVYTTEYLGDLEEVYGGTPPTNPMTKYFATPSGLPMAMRAGSTLSYLATDGLGSVSLVLDGSGNLTDKALYAPYGGTRYGGGRGPTTRGFTGQRADDGFPNATSGLDYFNARYYDPVAGQFLSPDTVSDGLNRYGYVHGNPETFNDPSGHRMDCGDACTGGGGLTPCQAAGYCKVPGVCYDPPCFPWTGPTSPGTGPSGGSASGPSSDGSKGAHGGCDTKCQDDARTTGIADVLFGLLEAAGAIAAMQLGCDTQVLCLGMFKATVPYLLEGIHIILDGADLIAKAAGVAVGSALTVTLRGVKVAIDVLQIIVAGTDIFSAIGELQEAVSGLEGIAAITTAIFAKKATADTIGRMFGDASGLRMFGLSIGDDLAAYQQSLNAWDAENAGD